MYQKFSLSLYAEAYYYIKNLGHLKLKLRSSIQFMMGRGKLCLPYEKYYFKHIAIETYVN